MSTSESILDTQRVDAELNVVQCLLLAKRSCGKSYLSTIREIRRLAKGIGKITPTEYFYYNLYDDARYTAEDKAAFFGKEAVRELDVKILKNAWNHIAADKLVFYALMRGFDLPVPETRAVYHRFRQCGAAVALRTPDQVADFLRDQIAYPVFAKPNGSVNSLGVASIESYDRSSDQLRLAGGGAVAVTDFVAATEAFAKEGYLFQERLMPHPDLVALCGPRMSTIRLYVVVGEAGAQILRASWKISVGDNPADNFWRSGNLLASIDVETGRVERVVTGAGPAQREVDCHPDSGARLLGISLPQWEQAKATCLAAAAALPACLVQGWDLAITDRGAVLIELEGNGGHPQMVQTACAEGLYRGAFKAFYDEHRARSEAAAQAQPRGLVSRLLQGVSFQR